MATHLHDLLAGEGIAIQEEDRYEPTIFHHAHPHDHHEEFDRRDVHDLRI